MKKHIQDEVSMLPACLCASCGLRLAAGMSDVNLALFKRFADSKYTGTQQHAEGKNSILGQSRLHEAVALRPVAERYWKRYWKITAASRRGAGLPEPGGYL